MSTEQDLANVKAKALHRKLDELKELAADRAVINEALSLNRALSVASRHVAIVNKDNGWYETDRRFAEDIALLHSEVSEALEAYREHGVGDVTEAICRAAGHSNPATAPGGSHLCKPEGVGSELADVFIRLLDTCQRYDINLAAEFERKLAYNRTRGHRHGGKNL